MYASSRHFAVATAIALLILLVGRPGLAQERDGRSDLAQALFEQAKDLLRQNNVDEACRRLTESQRLEPASGTLGMLAYCHELQGKTATAWDEYLRVAAMPRQDTYQDRERERTARERAAALEPRLSTLRIEVPSPLPGLSILLGDRRIEAQQWGVAVPVDPGQVLLQASAPGHKGWQAMVAVADTATASSVSVPPLERQEPASPTPPGRPRAPVPTPDAPSSRSWTAPVAAFGLGAVSIAAGSYFGLKAISKNEDSKSHCDADNACDPVGGRLRDEAHTAGTFATVGFAIGAAGLATGTVLLLTGTSSAATPKSGVRLAPHAGPEVAGLNVIGVF